MTNGTVEVVNRRGNIADGDSCPTVAGIYILNR